MSSSTHRNPDPSLPPGGEQPGRRPRRSSPRSFAPLAVAAWVVLEIWILIAVADAAGGWVVLLLLAAGFVLGGIVVKRAGLRAWRRLAESVQAAGGRNADPAGPRRPDRGGNALAMLGGVLIMTPGLLSDVAGLLCLFPPTAALIRRRTERSLERRMRGAAPGSLEDSLRQARIHRPDGKVVQGEVIREDERDDEGPSARP